MSIPGFFLSAFFNVFILGTLRALNKRLSNYYIMLTNMPNPSFQWEQEKLVEQDCASVLSQRFSKSS